MDLELNLLTRLLFYRSLRDHKRFWPFANGDVRLPHNLKSAKSVINDIEVGQAHLETFSM